MAMSDGTLRNIWAAHAPPLGDALSFARAIEAEVHKDDEALIRKCMEALECAGAYTALIDDISLSAIQEAYKAASARLEKTNEHPTSI